MADEPILQTISEAAFVNPSLTKVVAPDQKVSFIPMADVSDTGRWTHRQTRKQREVAVGYTPFEERDVLFAKITPCMENGKGCHALGLVNGVGYGSTEFHVLRAKPGTNDRFLYFWSVTDEMRKKAEAFMIGSAGQQRVQATFFDHFRIPRLDEDAQAFAARVLDAADEAIAKTETLIAKLKAIKQGLLHDLLTRGLDENGELRDPELHPEQFKDSPLGQRPKDWTLQRLGQMCDLLNGLAFKPTDWATTGLPIIRIQNLNRGEDFNYYDGVVADKYYIDPGTLLFSWSGNRGTSFGPFIWPGPRGILNQHIFKVTPKDGVRKRWFYYALDDVRQRVERVAHGGSGLVHIRRPDLCDYLIATPEPDEQERIETAIAAHDRRIDAEEAYLSKLKAIKEGLMRDLLTGRVRVGSSADSHDSIVIKEDSDGI